MIDIAHLHGILSVQEKKNIDIVVKLEVWNDAHDYDRSGLEEKTTLILDVDVPCQILPLKAGRDVVLLLETIALNYRLKKMGYHSAKRLESKLVSLMLHKGRMEEKWVKTN